MAKGPPCEGRKTIEPRGKGKSKTNSNFAPQILSGVESSISREKEREDYGVEIEEGSNGSRSTIGLGS